ncbi:MAG: hypothetical protein V1902_00505 [Candidatus Falkowbacteria bacterium]
MRKFMLLSALILGGCSFVVNWGTITDSNDDAADFAVIADIDVIEANDLISTDWAVDTEELTTEEVEYTDAQNCAENEYWEPHFNKCAFYPCCEIKGNWTFVFNDMTTFPWKPITYSAKLTQNKAYVKLEITSDGTLPLPETMSGTLEKSVLHLDGENDSGFLTLDAVDVKKQLESDKVEGDYVWLKADGAQMAGTFYLQRL